MLNEDPNNFSWKNKLENFDQLSEVILPGKNELWEKLHIRLEQKPRRSRIMWYLAAACLLAVIILSLTLTDKRNEDLASKGTKRAVTAEKLLPTAPALKQIIPGNITSASSKKTTPVYHLQPSTYPAALNEPVKDQPVLKIEAMPAPQKIFETTLPDSAVIATQVIVAKKKLKVVHINELGELIEETDKMKLVADHRNFQFKFINQETLNNSPLPSNNTGFNIFKTKNIPSN
ncbi:MAG: hypothetical protein ABIQ31_15090 [Ferruginibacter sp.]